jgi:hypothetical protein
MSWWMSFINLEPEAFPLEVFGYPEDSDDQIIYHHVLTSIDDGSFVPRLPQQRMRMKVFLATGEVLIGSEGER